jgi:hypothetical protein
MERTAVVYGYISPLEREPIHVLQVCDERGARLMNMESRRRRKIGYNTFVCTTECEQDATGNAFAGLVVLADRMLGKHGYEWTSIQIKTLGEWEFCRHAHSKTTHQYTLPYYIPVAKPKVY